MKKTKKISEDEMIREFIFAEINSDRRGDVIFLLSQTGYDEKIISHPDYSNPKENNARKLALSYRGYPDSYLFSGMPKFGKMFTALLNIANSKRIKTINCDPWLADSDGTRDFSVIARKIRNTEINNPKILKIAADYDSDKKLPLIICAKDLSTGEFIVIEGNHRMAALFLLGVKEIKSIIIEFENLNGWIFK